MAADYAARIRWDFAGESSDEKNVLLEVEDDDLMSPFHDRKTVLETAKNALLEGSSFVVDPQKRRSWEEQETTNECEEPMGSVVESIASLRVTTTKRLDYEEDEGPRSKLGAALLVTGLLILLVAIYFAILYLSIFLRGDNLSFEEETADVGFVEPEAGWTYHPMDHIAQAVNGTCLSLRERHLYYPTSPELAPSKALLEALRDYEEMHRRCVGSVRRWEYHFKAVQWGLDSCRYLVWKEDTGGLGNRFLSLLAAFEYALITNRAILVNVGALNQLLCDPIPGSSIWTPEGFPLVDLYTAPHQSEFMEGKTHHEGMEDLKRRDIVTAFLRHNFNDFPDANKFFCEKWQQRLANVTWMLWDSNQYVGPALFFVSSFEKRLLELFPDRMVTSHVARYMLHPLNNVWEQITRVYKAYFAHAGTRVGLQVRTFADYDPQVSVRLATCMSGERVLPKPMSEQKWDQLARERNWTARTNAAKDTRSLVSLFVASLDIGYYDYLKQMYTNRPTEDGRLVAVHVESHAGHEDHALSADEAALAEIWLLSLSDTLFISAKSTFGYVANALCGRKAYFLNIKDGEWQNNGQRECQLAWSSNGCYHVKPMDLTCPDELEHPFPDANTWLPYVKQCQDAKMGIVVVPNI